MENIFVKTNPVNGNYNINYVEVNNMMKTLNRAITTREEYVSWVRDWKKYHESLVTCIQAFRAKKNDIKNGVLTSVPSFAHNASELNELKLKLRPFARELYNLRTENKSRLRQGEFKELEAA